MEFDRSQVCWRVAVCRVTAEKPKDFGIGVGPRLDLAEYLEDRGITEAHRGVALLTLKEPGGWHLAGQRR